MQRRGTAGAKWSSYALRGCPGEKIDRFKKKSPGADQGHPSLNLAKQLRQLRDIRRDAPGFVFGE
jgi:hypothetical protein